jgi:hypothetical protein
MRLGLWAMPAGIVAAYVVIILSIAEPGLVVFGHILFTYAESLAAVWLMVGAGVLLVTMAKRQIAGEPSSVSAILRDFVLTRWREGRFLTVLLPFCCFAPTIAAYNTFKALLLPSAGFWFGRYLVPAERAIFGVDAWRITHAVLPSPWATQAIDLCYHGWFLPMVVGVALCSFAPARSQLSWRYLTSYLLLWTVQGSLIAYLLPAAGPALHAAMTRGPSRFHALTAVLAGQNAYLRAHGAPGLYSVNYQHGLIALFRTPIIAVGGGISAMPSLHNGMAVLFACASWSLRRWLGALFTAYALLIWFGSVHLGWHYALDGIVACVLTVATWQGVGYIPRLFGSSGQRHVLRIRLRRKAPADEAMREAA